jgi:hypothetical protein
VLAICLPNIEGPRAATTRVKSQNKIVKPSPSSSFAVASINNATESQEADGAAAVAGDGGLEFHVDADARRNQG